MTAPLDPQLPRVLDDVWEPPPPTRPHRLPAVIAAAVIVIACAAFVTVRAGVFEGGDPGSADANRSLWYPDSTERVGWRSQPAQSPVVAAERQPAARVRPAPPAPPAAPAAPARVTRRAARATPLPGYLAVNSTPWAELSVDGRVVGNTPQLGIRVTAGRHRLVLTRDGFAAETTWVTVAPGATVKITGIALTRVAP